MVRAPRWMIMISASSALLLVPACSSDNAPAPEPVATPTTSSSVPSESPSVATAEQLAIDAYLGMWNDMAIAGETSDWQNPILGQHATSIALTNLTNGLHKYKVDGIVSKGRPKNSPRVLSAEPGKIVLEDCGDSSDWGLYRVDTGAPVETEPGGLRHINAVVEWQSDDVWRVTDFGVHEPGSC